RHVLRLRGPVRNVDQPWGLRAPRATEKEVYRPLVLSQYLESTAQVQGQDTEDRRDHRVHCAPPQAGKASTITAAPWPPPMQAEPSPNRCFVRRKAWSKWIVTRVPVAASGWPMAIAPPCTLVLARSRPSSRSTARYCGANASFTSTRS